MQCTQINLGRSRAATAITREFILNKRVDILSFQEPLVREGRVLGLPISCRLCHHTEAKTGVAVFNPNLDLVSLYNDPHICAARISGQRISFILISVYCPPSIDICPILDRLSELGERYTDSQLCISGDFNAKSQNWGSPTGDGRGDAVVDFLNTNNWYVHNNPRSLPTFFSGNGESWIDLTISTNAIAESFRNWDVVDEPSGSDHRFITWIISSEPAIELDDEYHRHRYSLNSVDWPTLDKGFAEAFEPLLAQPLSSHEEIDYFVNIYTAEARRVCDSLLRKRSDKIHRSVPWWSPG